jgi:hypothetical protein
MRVHQIARALTLSVALAVVGLIAATPASAAEERKGVLPSGHQLATERVKSRVKINSIRKRADAWLVEGVVRSRVNGCERGRLMELNTGRGKPWAREVRDKDRTDRRGRFTLYGTEIRRLASVRATSVLSKPNRRVECNADTSRRFTLPPPSYARPRSPPAGPKPLERVTPPLGRWSHT